LLSAWRQQLRLPSAQHLDTPTLNALLIALLAVALKFIVLDLHEVRPGQLLGLAAIALVLRVVYWLMRERDDRQLGTSGRED